MSKFAKSRFLGFEACTQVQGTTRHKTERLYQQIAFNQSIALNLDDSAGSSNSVFDLHIDKIAASTTIVPHTTDHNRIDDNNSPINHVAHSTNISAIHIYIYAVSYMTHLQ